LNTEGVSGPQYGTALKRFVLILFCEEQIQGPWRKEVCENMLSIFSSSLSTRQCILFMTDKSQNSEQSILSGRETEKEEKS
jgi:hypothetical protein